MFRIQNQVNGKEQEFPNREALLLGLEGEENRCLQLNTSVTFHVFHYDKNEGLLESMELTIPSSKGQDVKELLGDFGLKGEDKNPFWNRSKKQIQTRETLTNGQVSPSGITKLFKSLIGLLPMVLSLTSLYVSIQTFQFVKTQPQDNPKTEVVLTDQKADVFCRYFISNYFSQNENLGDFLSVGLTEKDLTTDKTTPVSVLLESQEMKNETTTVTYVVNLKASDDTVSSQRLMLSVKSDQAAKYGYLVTKTPKLTAYP